LAINGPVAIIGSTNRGDDKTQADAKAAAYHLGQALAQRGYRIIVYSDDPRFLESEIARGYLAVELVGNHSIEVRYPDKLDDHGTPKPPPFNAYFQDPRFKFLPDENPDWEVSYYASFEEIGGMLLLQGGKSALVSGVTALGYRKPLIVCGGFGGAATGLLNRLLERNLVLPEEKALLQSNPAAADLERWAEQCIDLFDVQNNRLAQQRANDLLSRKLLRKQLNWHAFIALAAIVIAISFWVLNWNNRAHLPPWAVAGCLFASSALAGATGAMLWVILPYLKGKPPAVAGSLWGSSALGLLAGIIAALLFVFGQEHGLPNMKSYITGPGAEETIERIEADFLAKLIPASILSSLAAGVTLDRALAKLIKREPEEGG
jgi:hypothetical protein